LSYSYTNLQIKTGDPGRVREAIDLCNIGTAKMLARAEVSWVSVYPFMTEDDFAYLKECAERVSRRMALPVFGFMVPNGAVFRYILYEHGDLVDEYSYDPQAQELVSGGKVDAVLSLAKPGMKKSRLQQLLHPSQPPQTERDREVAGDRLALQFAEILGIPRVQMCVGFNHLKWAQAGR